MNRSLNQIRDARIFILSVIG